MKLVKSGGKVKSWRDKGEDGKFPYACPYCISQGKKAQSSTICITFTAPLEDGKRIYLKEKDMNAHCYECGQVVATLINRKWIKVDLVE